MGANFLWILALLVGTNNGYLLLFKIAMEHGHLDT
jgi:hypothetical protein